jgi:hypothetical protein
MEIKEFLSLGSSRLNADILSDKMEEDPGLFDTVWEIMLEEEDPVSMRAAWSLTVFARRHPYFIGPMAGRILKALQTKSSASVRRCLLSLLTHAELKQEHAGYLFNFCYGIVESPASEIAHKAYAMTILYNISEMETGLKPELVTLFKSKLDDDSSGIKARSRILLKKLYRDLSIPG